MPHYNNEDFFNQKLVGSELIYLISWVDSLEKLDSIMLEIRHLQLNIIYLLREPLLYEAIRKEESLLWGGSKPEDSWSQMMNETSNDELIVTKIIETYPSPPEKDTFYGRNKKSDESDSTPLSKVRKRIDEIWRNSVWSKSQKRAYYSLVGLQYLKKEVLEDKIRICRHAKEKSFIHRFHPSNNIAKSKAQFMILRGAIMHRASKNYIERLSDYYQEYETYIDNDSDGLPRSSIHRRREIYLYSSFLNERAVGTLDEMNLLFKEILEINDDDKPGKDNTLKEKIPSRKNIIFIHNWKNSHKSSSKDFKVNVSDEDKNKILHLSTNFWMPERPDLQPVISHEIAHSFIRAIYDDMNVSTIQASKDQFSYLLVRIENIIDTYRANSPGNIILEPGVITREIACDFLAASINGISYLFAFFLEFIGQHWSFSGLLVDSDENELIFDRLYQSKAGRIGINLYDTREWYVRGKILVEWIKQTHHRNKKNKTSYNNYYLDSQVIDGIDQVLDDILDYYIAIAANEDQATEERLWRVMSRQICDLIKANKTCKLIKKWRGKRSNSEYNNAESSDDGDIGERLCFPRHTKRLHSKIRDHLFTLQLSMKMNNGRPLCNIEEVHKPYIEDIFNSFYISNKSDYFQKMLYNKHHPEKQFDGKGPLYKHIYDIPWQSAMMRAKDIHWKFEVEIKEIKGLYNLKIYPATKAKNDSSFYDVLYDLQNNFPFGRDLFSYAMEFHLYDSISPRVRVANNICMLNNWLHTKNISEPDKELIKNLKKNDKSEERQKPKKINNFREKESLAGERLEKLNSKIAKSLSEGHIEEYSSEVHLKTISTFLNTHSRENNLANSFIDKILKAFSFYTLNDDSNDIRFNDRIKFHSLSPLQPKILYHSHLIGRIALAGSYISIFNKNSDLIFNRSSVFDNVAKAQANNRLSRKGEFDSWFSCAGNTDSKQITRYYFNLGRFDIFSISMTSLPCHCPLPTFSNLDEDDNEKFPTFVSRKELAIPIRLDITREWPFSLLNTNRLEDSIKPISFLFITLKQASYRLPLVYRLISAIENPSTNEIYSSIENSGTLFDSNDCAFLTDGKADLLLAFHDSDDKKIERIFDLQNILYEDFMVDRTRLAFSLDAINKIKEINKSKYDEDELSVTVKVRLMENRMLDYSNHYFNIPEKKDGLLYKTPGQYDFTFLPTKEFLKKDNLYGEISKIFKDNPYIDKVETTIMRKWKIQT